MDGMFDDQEYCKGCETETELFRNFDLCDPKCTTYYSPLLGIHNSYVVISQVESSTSIDQMKSFISYIILIKY